MAANQVWQTAPLFYGASAQKGLDLDAEEFLERMEALNLAANPPLAGADAVRAVAANLRGQARIWWTKYLPYSMTSADLVILRADYEIFKTRFKREYFPFSEISDAAINWTAYTQGAQESAYLFIHRVNSAAREFSQLVKTAGDEAIPAAHGDHGLPAGAALTAYNAIVLPADRLAILRAFQAKQVGFRNDFAIAYCTHVVLKVCLNGIKDNRVKPLILKGINRGDTLPDLMDHVRKAESQMSPHSSGNTKNLHKIMGVSSDHHSHVMGMGSDGVYRYKSESDGVTPISDIDAAEIARLGFAPKGPANKWPKKKKGNKKNNKPHVHDASKSCNFCHRPGHDESSCRTKEGFSMDEKSKRASDKPRQGVHATGADDEGIHHVGQALNSILMM
jgi:hypothetical protein